MADVLNLYQKLAKIRKQVEVVQKNKSGYGYKYVTDDELLAKITVGIHMNIKVKKLRDGAKLPTQGSVKAAGYDLYACGAEYYEATIYPHETFKVGTGLSMAIPDGYFGAIFARSGLAAKQGLRPANCVGVVDSDYRGEVIVALHNDSDVPQTYHNGDRIAQLVIMPYMAAGFDETNELDETERGDGGFGHTGA